MINLQSNRAKQQYLFYVDRQMNVFEIGFAKRLNTALRKQWKTIADFVEIGSFDIDHVLNVTFAFFSEIFKNHYKRVYFLFGDIIFNQLKEQEKSSLSYERKTIKDDYLEVMKDWAERYMAEQIIAINKTTKKQIASVIEKGMSEGISNREIAKQIIQLSDSINLKRAIRIARTETHTVAMKSTNEAMASTGFEFSKEWISANDSRTRHGSFNHVAANGETVKKDHMYVKTGEALQYPGDGQRGSAGNIINCRCVEIYHTV
jgi:hypothetical protein